MTADTMEAMLAIGLLSGVTIGLFVGYCLGLITKAKADDNVPDDSFWTRERK